MKLFKLIPCLILVFAVTVNFAMAVGPERKENVTGEMCDLGPAGQVRKAGRVEEQKAVPVKATEPVAKDAAIAM